MSLWYEGVGDKAKLMLCSRCGERLQVIRRHEDGSYAEIGCPTLREGHTHSIYLCGGTLDLGIIKEG